MYAIVGQYTLGINKFLLPDLKYLKNVGKSRIIKVYEYILKLKQFIERRSTHDLFKRS